MSETIDVLAIRELEGSGSSQAYLFYDTLDLRRRIPPEIQAVCRLYTPNSGRARGKLRKILIMLVSEGWFENFNPNGNAPQATQSVFKFTCSAGVDRLISLSSEEHLWLNMEYNPGLIYDSDGRIFPKSKLLSPQYKGPLYEVCTLIVKTSDGTERPDPDLVVYTPTYPLFYMEIPANQ